MCKGDSRIIKLLCIHHPICYYQSPHQLFSSFINSPCAFLHCFHLWCVYISLRNIASLICFLNVNWKFTILLSIWVRFWLSIAIFWDSCWCMYVVCSFSLLFTILFYQWCVVGEVCFFCLGAWDLVSQPGMNPVLVGEVWSLTLHTSKSPGYSFSII